MNTKKINYYVMPGLMREKTFKTHEAVLLVCERLGISHRELVSPSRSRKLAQARNICYALIREHSFTTLVETGQYFKRDHTTVIHGLTMHNNDMKLLDGYADRYEQIKFELNTITSNKKNTNYVK
jgi:chromosomal replication initiation ATPase DnaA